MVNSDPSQAGQSIHVGERLPLHHTVHVQIPADSTETEMHITANEPTDNIKIRLSAYPQAMRIKLNCRHYTVKASEYDRFVDTQQQYHKMYTQA